MLVYKLKRKKFFSPFGPKRKQDITIAGNELFAQTESRFLPKTLLIQALWSSLSCFKPETP